MDYGNREKFLSSDETQAILQHVDGHVWVRHFLYYLLPFFIQQAVTILIFEERSHGRSRDLMLL